MDLLGIALRDLAAGQSGDFTFIDSAGRSSAHDIARYLRKPNQLNFLEKKLISRSRGNILDVGCATGYYLPLLMKKGKAVGIDVSPNLIAFAKKKGLSNCFVGDILKYRSPVKFDTITLLENNIGLGGSVVGTKKLLIRLKKMLSPEGQILMIVRKIDDRNYFKIRLRPCWRGLVGESFGWISFNLDYLRVLLVSLGFKVEIIGEDEKSCLLKASSQ